MGDIVVFYQVLRYIAQRLTSAGGGGLADTTSSMKLEGFRVSRPDTA